MHWHHSFWLVNFEYYFGTYAISYFNNIYLFWRVFKIDHVKVKVIWICDYQLYIEKSLTWISSINFHYPVCRINKDFEGITAYFMKYKCYDNFSFLFSKIIILFTSWSEKHVFIVQLFFKNYFSKTIYYHFYYYFSFEAKLHLFFK